MRYIRSLILLNSQSFFFIIGNNICPIQDDKREIQAVFNKSVYQIAAFSFVFAKKPQSLIFTTEATDTERAR